MLGEQYCASFNSHELVRNAQRNKYHELVFKVPEGVGEGGYGPATWRDSCVRANNTKKLRAYLSPFIFICCNKEWCLDWKAWNKHWWKRNGNPDSRKPISNTNRTHSNASCSQCFTCFISFNLYNNTSFRHYLILIIGALDLGRWS